MIVLLQLVRRGGARHDFQHQVAFVVGQDNPANDTFRRHVVPDQLPGFVGTFGETRGGDVDQFAAFDREPVAEGFLSGETGPNQFLRIFPQPNTDCTPRPHASVVDLERGAHGRNVVQQRQTVIFYTHLRFVLRLPGMEHSDRFAEAARLAEQLAEYVACQLPGVAQCCVPVFLNDERYDVTVKWKPVLPEADEEQPIGMDEQIEAVSEAMNQLILNQLSQSTISMSAERQIDALRAATRTLVEIAAKSEGESDEWRDQP